jgi:hypothetical protein
MLNTITEIFFMAGDPPFGQSQYEGTDSGIPGLQAGEDVKPTISTTQCTSLTGVGGFLWRSKHRIAVPDDIADSGKKQGDTGRQTANRFTSIVSSNIQMYTSRPSIVEQRRA